MKKGLLRSAQTITVCCLLAALLSRCGSTTPARSQLEEGFANPPMEDRPLAYWPWLNGYVDTTKMVFELNEMKKKGMRGAFIWDVGAIADPGKMVPAGPPFLGPTSLGYISLALRTAKKLGLDLGMCISSSWNAGGPWIGNGDASKALVSVSQTISGPGKKHVIIGSPPPIHGHAGPYSLITSIAVPHTASKMIDYSGGHVISLDPYTSADSVIDWQVPEGKWDILSFFMANTGQHLECPSPNSDGLIIDHLSRTATRKDFDTVLARLATVSTPEDHLKFLELDSYEVWPADDWTPGFDQQFRARYGYDPKPFLPLLEGYGSKDSLVRGRFLGDYHRLISDLIIENHFAQSVAIAHAHGMTVFTEAGHGGYARVDPLKGLGNTDVPMGEFWNRQKNWVTKEAASAAHIYGKRIVASESLTGWQNWQQGPTDFKQLCDIAFCAGLNQVVFHNFAHNPAMAGKPGFAYHAGEHINVNDTWWDMARPFMDYLSRCSFMLRQGNFVGDVCLYYGDQAPNLVPSRRIDPNIAPLYDDNHCLHCGKIKPINPGKLPGYECDYLDADVLTTQLQVANGQLVLPSGQKYRVIEIPDSEDLSLAVLKKLDTLVYNGAVVIGPKPRRTTSLKNYPEGDREVRAIAARMWGACDGKAIRSNRYGKGMVYWGQTVQQVLLERHIPPDVTVSGVDNSDNHIDFIHRKTAAEDIYFISNSKPSTEKVTLSFRVPDNEVPELWDPVTGLIQRKVDYQEVSDGIRMDFVMDPLASRFVVFRAGNFSDQGPEPAYDLQYGFNGKKGLPEPNKRYDLSYNWSVSFNPDMGGPSRYHLDSLVSWTSAGNEGIKYYSGTAAYGKDFDVHKEDLSNGTKAFVMFDDIQEMADVLVNGKDCGVVWTPPYQKDITRYLRPGSNHITVRVVNTWNNRIVGDLRYPGQKQYTTTNIKYKFKADGPLLNSGLIGKACLLFVRGNG